MLIKEIVRTTYHEPQQVPKASSRGSWDQEDPEALGQGSFARVIQDPADPHMVLRQEYKFTDPRKNGFLHWAQEVRDHAAENPYLPRIYDIEQEQARTKGRVLSRYTYRIERLFSGETLNAEQILALGEYNFRDYEALMAQHNGPKWRTLDDESLWHSTIKLIRIYLTEGPQHIAQPDLIQANKLIAQASGEIQGSRSVVYDLFPDNIMIRMYPAPHLVITDPIGS